MKRLILLLWLIPWLCFGDAGIMGNIANVSSPSGGTDYTQDANCMAAWFMNGTTTETDRSVTGTSTLTEASGLVGSSATVPSGYSGLSRDFDAAATAYLATPDGGATDISGATQPISMVFWIKNETAPSSSVQYINKFGQQQYLVGVANSKVYFGLRKFDNSGAVYSGGDTVISDTSQYHVACVSDNTDMRIYVNGSLDMTPLAYTFGIYNNTQNLRIGSSVNGLMDEVGIFDRALTATEVSNIYTDGIDGSKGGND